MPHFSKLIVDANILFSFFKKDSTRRRLIEELLNRETELVSPHFMLHELRVNKDKIMQLSNISFGEFELTVRLIEDEINLIPEDKFKGFLSNASKLSPHPKDKPYFALSLALDKCPIWSDESAFKRQSEIKIFSTFELLKLNE
ncbi:hypothetical protein HY449_04035 [Candidatus Pacearchaeota archaeon]|nr:hypothetical protein [Candidatus Pacearchaeota archaeon]